MLELVNALANLLVELLSLLTLEGYCCTCLLLQSLLLLQILLLGSHRLSFLQQSLLETFLSCKDQLYLGVKLVLLFFKGLGLVDELLEVLVIRQGILVNFYTRTRGRRLLKRFLDGPFDLDEGLGKLTVELYLLRR